MANANASSLLNLTLGWWLSQKLVKWRGEGGVEGVTTSACVCVGVCMRVPLTSYYTLY